MAPPSTLTPAEQQKLDDIKFLPAPFRHCLNGKWKLYVPEQALSHTVMFEDEFQSMSYSKPYVDTIRFIATSIRTKLQSLGKDVDELNIFRYLIEPALRLLAEYAMEQLVKDATDSEKSMVGTSVEEIWEFIATKYFRSTFRVLTEVAWEMMEAIAAIPTDRQGQVQKIRGSHSWFYLKW